MRISLKSDDNATTITASKQQQKSDEKIDREKNNNTKIAKSIGFDVVVVSAAVVCFA